MPSKEEEMAMVVEASSTVSVTPSEPTTDRQTDGRTDGHIYHLIEMQGRIYRHIFGEQKQLLEWKLGMSLILMHGRAGSGWKKSGGRM